MAFGSQAGELPLYYLLLAGHPASTNNKEHLRIRIICDKLASRCKKYTLFDCRPIKIAFVR